MVATKLGKVVGHHILVPPENPHPTLHARLNGPTGMFSMTAVWMRRITGLCKISFPQGHQTASALLRETTPNVSRQLIWFQIQYVLLLGAIATDRKEMNSRPVSANKVIANEQDNRRAIETRNSVLGNFHIGVARVDNRIKPQEKDIEKALSTLFTALGSALPEWGNRLAPSG